jgi:hypothetical protein
VLERKPRSGASGAGLHFVEHEQPLVLIADPAQAGQVIGMTDLDAALALDELDQDRDHVAVTCRDAPHRFEVVERHAHEAREQRFETGLDLAAAGRGEGRHRPAVESLFHDDDRRRLDAFVVPVEARELDRRFVRFATGIAQEHVVHTGDRGEAVSELLLQIDLVDVRSVDERRHLLLEHTGEPRMRVSQAADRDAGKRVEVAPALHVPQP